MYREFLNAATLNNEIQFAEVGDVEVAKVFWPKSIGGSPFVGLVKDDPERFTAYGKLPF